MTNIGTIEWVRSDRLGDLLCSLPSLWQLRQAVDSSTRVLARIQPQLVGAVAPLLEEWGVGLAEDGAERSDAAVLLNSDFSEMWRIWKRGVPLRVGPYSKMYSYPLLSHGLRQRRSRADRHEGVYGEALVSALLQRLGLEEKGGPLVPHEIPKCERAARVAEKKLGELGLAPKGFWVLHPGMGGSAVNLSTEAYVHFAKDLAEKVPVVLSEGPQDEEMVSAIREHLPLPVLRGLSLPELREAFRLASGLAAPSTGPLHLAHWVGTPVFGMFPPVRSQNLGRWAPRGGSGPVRVVAPEVECPAKRHCLGDRCDLHPCMARQPWSRLLFSAKGVWLEPGGIHG